MKPFVLSALLVLASHGAGAQQEAFENYESLLPPLTAWSGASEQLVVPADDPWITPAERTGLTATPGYDETVAWLEKLVAASPELEMVSIGKSLQGRDFWMVVASSDGAFTPAAMQATGKPLLLAQAGIHSGEIDGKDAGLMLLRDMTARGTQRGLLEQANFLFVPILNVDGHENLSRYSRINQRGPQRMGWRTNARNQNFNRDYAKLDTPGVRAVVGVMQRWRPDLYLDLHVTDGADYQYDITFGGNGSGGWSPEISRWISTIYRENLDFELSQAGHVPGPLILSVNNRDMADGYWDWTAGPRFSNGYGDARHVPAILVENHSLKPYRQRVLGTYVLLAASLRLLAQEQASLRLAVAKDLARRPQQLALGFAPGQQTPPSLPFRGIRSETVHGGASGGPVTRWTGEADESPVARVPIDQPGPVVTLPRAYLVPPEWADIAERLAWHGIAVERLAVTTSFEVERYRLPGAGIAPAAGWTPNPFEGRVRIDPGQPEVERLRIEAPAGSFRVPLDHALSELAGLLLEPQSADSFFQWGFFLEIFTRTEYAEPYVMEPLAQAMLARDSELARRFEEKLASDADFAADPQARLMWFYEQTPFYDPRYKVYPVLRIVGD